MNDAETHGTEGSPAGMPRWVKVSGLIILLLVALFVIINLAGIGPDHGPSRHTGGDAQEQEVGTLR